MSHPLKDRSFVALTVSQCLGAFNDNVYRQFILLLAVGVTIPWLPEGIDNQAVALACFSLPFVVFSLFAGSLADKFSKRSIIVRMNIAEIVAMVLGTLAFLLHDLLPDQSGVNASVIASMLVLFFMGTQSAIFGPSKYGSIPEIVDEKNLTRANSIISMTTNLGIVFGAVVAGALITFLHASDTPFYYSGVFFITVAILGWCASLFIHDLPPADPGRKLETNFLALPKHALGEAKFLAKDRDLFGAVLADGWFYLVSASALPVFNVYAINVLGAGDRGGTTLFAVIGIGIGIGSLMASWLSRQRLELGLMLWGSFGMSAGFLSLFFIEGATGAKIATFIAGLFGGLYIVPIITFLQQRPKKSEKGRVLGATELFTFLFIFASAIVFNLLSIGSGMLAEQFGWFAPQLAPKIMCAALGILMLLGPIALCCYAPIFVQRAILVAIGTVAYRIEIHGQENVPRQGGAILVPNHASYADPFLVAYGCPRVPRFIMHRWFLNVPLVGWFTRLMNVIPISSEDGPRALVRALDEAAKSAKDGHTVCIFPEGSITRTGNMLPFSKGVEKIAVKSNVPIVPVYLDRVWGSMFSYQHKKFFWKKPRGVPYRTSVHYGKPLPPGTPIEVVRAAVQELGAEALDRRKAHGETLATRFLRYARRYPRRLAMADPSKKELTYRKALISTLVLRKLLQHRVEGQDRVGVLLPNGIAGALVNVALALLGKTSVNLNYTAGRESFDSAVEQCGLRTIITSPRFLEKLKMDADPRHVHVEDVLGEATGAVKFRAALVSLLPSFLLKRLPGIPKDPDTDATIIFSSGSTGSPKGVRLTHHNIMSNVRSLAQIFDPVSDDRIMGVLPFFHSFGYTATIWLPFLTGFGAVYHPNPIDAKTIASLLKQYRPTIFISTPTFYQSYLRRFDTDDMSSVRIAASGAEKLKSSLLEQWREKFGHDILEGYGCTELSPAVSINIPNVTDRDVEHIGSKRGTIGHPIPGVAVKVVEPESYEPLPIGDEGMLLVKGANVMAGYLGQPEMTSKVIIDGWYVTGDVARLDRDGFIEITGRLSRFSKIGGEMVPHIKIEEAVQRILDEATAPSSTGSESNAAEAAVTSVPDPDKGERLVVLCANASLPLEEIHSALQTTDLPKLWLPRRDAFFEISDLPKLGSGKLDLKSITRLAEERVFSKSDGKKQT